jgi:N-acetyltransferase
MVMSAVLQSRLEGETILCAPTRTEDWAELFAVAADPLIWAVHPAHDRWQEPVFRAYFADALASEGGLTIRERQSGRVIGASRYATQRAMPGEVEIGWTFLARDHWGGATNRELKQLMVNHVLHSFDAAIFLVGEHNVRSRRAMEKIGGMLTDRTFDAPMAGGVVSRHVIYRIDQPL